MTLQQHPLSAAYPSMSADEFQSLLDSVEVIGIQSPITLYDGMVIDGWHRYRAATQLGMAYPFVELPDDVDPQDFARSQGARRNLTVAQRAMAIVAIYDWHDSRPKSALSAHRPKKTSQELADMEHVSRRTIDQAKKVDRKATPKVKAAIESGAIGLVKAAQIAQLPKDQQDAAIDKPLTKSAPKEYETGGEPEDHGPTAVEILSEENDRLNSRLAVAAMEATPEERQLAEELIADLRSQVRSLTAELGAVKSSRDSYMREVGELKKQCVSNRKQIDKLQKHADTSRSTEAF
jgi:ParB-like chromosome segregation protein Spo0J